MRDDYGSYTIISDCGGNWTIPNEDTVVMLIGTTYGVGTTSSTLWNASTGWSGTGHFYSSSMHGQYLRTLYVQEGSAGIGGPPAGNPFKVRCLIEGTII
jgi:hypothetical protein